MWACAASLSEKGKKKKSMASQKFLQFFLSLGYEYFHNNRSYGN